MIETKRGMLHDILESFVSIHSNNDIPYMYDGTNIFTFGISICMVSTIFEHEKWINKRNIPFIGLLLIDEKEREETIISFSRFFLLHQ